jgi:predicted SAM-dependent methyltransferase
MRQALEAVVRTIVNNGLSALNRPFAQWRFRRAVRDARGPIFVSTGAGRCELEGWLNTDVSWRASLYLDLTKPWPVRSASIARIYADNVIEHFSLRVGRRVLQYAFAALEQDGRIRLATPDVERTDRAYLNDPDLTSRHLERHRRFGYDVHYPVDLLRVTFSECGHHLGFCYDFNALSGELDRAGFVDIERFAPGESNDPILWNLEARTEPTEGATSLIVEARRPRTTCPKP